MSNYWKKRLKKGDWFLTGALVFIAVSIWVGFALQQTDSVYGEIWQDGNLIQKIKLSDSYHQTFTVKGKKYTNVIEVDGKKMRFSSSDCPNKVCVHTGWISKSGQVAACIPNHVLIKITGGESEVDAVTS